jgi:crotonobetainyl-CoA:carnitine CoA-transferase CaiB-like acyl-CoA transferase
MINSLPRKTNMKNTKDSQDKPITSSNQKSSPLAGVRVLEVGSSISGPAAGRLMADLGADVIKIEPPEGDTVRKWGILAPDESSWFFKSLNRGKRFVTLDLHHSEDVETLRSLIAGSDALIENFVPGRMAKWGLGYEDVRKINDRLVYVSISGFGQDGPYSDRPGYGNIAESVGGLRYITGFPDRPPLRVGVSIADELAGLYAVIGLLAALRARERDGHGDHIDVALSDAILSVTQGTLPEFGATGVVRERVGNIYLSSAPSNTYPTKDERWIAIGANSNSLFRRFCQAIGNPGLAEDARFSDVPARVANEELLDEIIAEWTHSHDCDDIESWLRKAGVPVGPVMSVAHIAKDPHFIARNMVATIADDEGNRVMTPGIIPKFQRYPVQLGNAAGCIGRDTKAVLAECSTPAPEPEATLPTKAKAATR